jgi:hypothetical protein
MKTEKIYAFAIDNPLTAAKRKTVEKYIDQNAGLSPKPVTYNWDESDRNTLHISAEPISVEVRFNARTVDLYATAPLWARLLFTKQKKVELKDQIELVLQKAKFVSPLKAKAPKIKPAAAASKPVAGRKKAVVTRKPAPPKAKSAIKAKSVANAKSAVKAKPKAAQKAKK